MPFDATPISSPVIDRLRECRELVARPNGWCKGTLNRIGDDGGFQYCAVGAASPGHRLFGHVMRYLKIALVGREVPEMVENFRVVQIWNDRPERQQHEVVQLWDVAIDEAIADQLTLTAVS